MVKQAEIQVKLKRLKLLLWIKHFSFDDGKSMFLGVELNDLKNHGIKIADMNPYLPVRREKIENLNLEVHYT